MPRIASLAPIAGLFASVTAAFLLACFATPGRAGDEVCLSDPMDFAGGPISGCLAPKDAEQLMDRALTGGARGFDGVSLTDPADGSQRREVHTCREYEAAIHDGWFAQSTVDMTAESFFKRNCGFLHAVAHARAARTSFLSVPLVGLANLDLVRAQTISELVPEASGSIQSLLDAGAVSIDARGARRIEVSTKNATATLVEIGRGDFDGDGYEDLFTLLVIHAKGGTMRSYQTILLSRHSADGMFDVKPLSLDG